jgi:hypothetical protein
VCLYNVASKQGRSKKFHSPLSGPFEITANLPDLNYELLGNNCNTIVVHINRMKPCYGPVQHESNPARKWRRKVKSSGDKLRKLRTPAAILSYPLAIDEFPDRGSPTPPNTPVTIMLSAGRERSDTTCLPPYTPL